MVPLIEAAADVAVPGRYIVVFKDGVDKDAAPFQCLEKISTGGGKLAFEYASALDGLSAEFSPEVLRKLRQDLRIEYIEMDQKVTVHQEDEPFGVQTLDTSPDSWGLDRIDQTNLPLDTKFYYPSSAGQGVNVYIIDTGIRNTHENFNGRVALDFDAIGGSTTYAADCDGHGTHVAGTAAGLYTGVARKANIHSVRVLDCTGSGYTSQIVAGIDWVAKNHVKPAVANMSLGGSKSTVENAAVTKAIAKGVTFVVAAGNSDDHACDYSPASAPGAITVGATDNTDTRAWFSNYDNCVDIFAPGVDIYSSIIDSNTSYDGTWDGTSMAAPHVTGVAALFLSANPTAKPKDVTKYILDNALVGYVADPGSGSPNRLLAYSNIVPVSGPVLVSPAKYLTSDNTPTFTWKPLTDANTYTLHLYDRMLQTQLEILKILKIPNTHRLMRFQMESTVGLSVPRILSMYMILSHNNGFSRLTPLVQTAPEQTFPAAGATVNGYPTFKWLAPSGAKTYRFAYDYDGSVDENFDFISLETTKLLYKPVVLPVNTFIYWSVQAKDSLGNPGSWSTPRQLWVNPLPPAAPKLISLINNAATKDQDS